MLASTPLDGGAGQQRSPQIIAASISGATHDRRAVLQTVDEFFAAIAKGDLASITSILHPDGVLFSKQHPDEADTTFRHRTNSEWLDGMRRQTARYVEHTSNSVVSVRGPIAVVWQSYRVEVQDKFSHCGVNIVSLVRMAGSWKIASIVWTIERHDCPQ